MNLRGSAAAPAVSIRGGMVWQTQEGTMPASAKKEDGFVKVELEKILEPDMAEVEKVETVIDDGFNLEDLRLDQSFIETSVKKLLTTVPVRRPSKQDFIRVHSDPAYRANLAIVELRDERETYLLSPNIARALPGEFSMATIYTAVNRQGVCFLWPVKLPEPDGRMIEWHRAAQEAAEIAMTRWVRVKANMSLGAYDIIAAMGVIPDPVWPEEKFEQLLRIGFRSYFVNSFDHPLVKRLTGAV
jgi:hypothetical protein